VISKVIDDVRPAGAPQAPPPAAAEQEPVYSARDRTVAKTDRQVSVTPMAVTSEPSADADPGDIIDWLIQKKRTDGRSQRQMPDDTQPAGE
jgi:hypothetical protein